MKQRLLFCLLIPFFSFSQIQIGSKIIGESNGDNSGNSVSLSSDGNIVAIGAYFNDGVNGEESGHVRVYENQSGIWTQIGDDIDGEAAGDRSGVSVSLSSDGSIVAIGAYGNSNSYGPASGHVRVYENQSGVWTQIGSDIDGESSNNLGYSVSLSDDGSIVAIGEVGDSGLVRVLENQSGVWTQIGNDINGEASGDRSGHSVSLSSDGSIVAIGAPFNNGNGGSSGHVRIYENQSGVWTQIGNDIDGEPSPDYSGWSVSLSSNGSIVAIGAINYGGSGYVRVYENQSGVWTQIGLDIDGEQTADRSGHSVSLSSDGSIVAIGAILGNDGNNYNTGDVRVFKNQSGVWTQIGNDIDGEVVSDWFGYSISLSSDGSIVAIGANDGNSLKPGYVKVYDLNAVLSTKSFENDYFSFYPNPVKDLLNIDINKGLELKQVNIYTLEGRYLYSVKSKKIETKHLTSGMYVFEMETNAGKSAKKIIIE